MRIKLTLDDDIARQLREEARLQGRTLSQVVNDTLRLGLSPDTREIPKPQYRIVPNRSALVPGINPTKLKQIGDQLEAECFGRTSSSS